MKKKVMLAALAAGFGMAAWAQPPANTRSGTATPQGGTIGGSVSGTANGRGGAIQGRATSATSGTGSDLVRQELDDLTEFIDLLVEEFQIEFESDVEARAFVLAATHFYMSAKMTAATQGPRSAGKR
jgi:hypothetical protein